MAYLLQHVLTESAALYPGKEAVVFLDENITYAELESESNRLANSLTTLDIKRGERVGIYMNRGINSVIAAFGVLKAGATYVPIDPLCPHGRLNYILKKCEVKLLITSQKKLSEAGQDFFDGTPLQCVLTMNGIPADHSLFKSLRLADWQVLRRTMSNEAVDVHTINSDLAYVLFTSGSTGHPKGVMISHLNALTFIESAHDFFHIKPTDRLSNVCPLHFDMSVFDLYVAFKAGAAVVIIPEATTMFPVKLASAIVENGITVWNSVPSALSLLAAYENLESHDLSCLRLILFAGEPFPLKYLRRLQDLAPTARFCNMYGQTEANSSTYYWVDKVASSKTSTLPIGRPLPNYDVFALDEKKKQITEPGQEGEFYVRSSTVARGYWGDTERTEQSFVMNPLAPESNEKVYRTGDLVELDFDGNYVFKGRKDHMIKSRGYRIEIGEIETVLCGHPDIKNAVVVPIPDELVGNRISAYIVPFRKGAIGVSDVAKYCFSALPKYMVPEVIEFCELLPMTSSGKVDRKQVVPLAKQVNQPAGGCAHEMSS